MKKLMFGVLMVIVASPLYAAKTDDTSTYEVDPLTLSVRTLWDEDIKTVRQAVNWIIEPTGYRLMTTYPAPMSSALIVKKRLPNTVKAHRTMPIIDVLQLLIGMDNTIIVDKRNRLISFEKGIQ